VPWLVRNRWWVWAGVVVAMSAALAFLALRAQGEFAGMVRFGAVITWSVGVWITLFVMALVGQIAKALCLRQQQAQRLCTNCGYPLSGIRARVCPECGKDL